MFSLTTTTILLATLTSLTLAAPTAQAPPSYSSPPAPQPLGISLSTDAHCSTLTSSTPTSLVNGTCYPVPSGFASMEVYAPPIHGLLTVFATGECVVGNDTQYFSTEYRGCMGLKGEGRGIMYTAQA
ncbi:hypothetical protein CLAFUW4_00251 [Fulvia fulva]|uniref:Uncharacterized protein n=1 Tax=Passalora fulva TaxID=5499 RepID=A0A9Q8P341_PASFU|nr:uncharacterized protein CLAFUR5_00251 [Fulvia fulva]KAK4635382.1 hypothetical protein CLAFUR4_00251 [Fulvia fulva]KAK4638337.1 hypothetical protein CLAFUR0_00252 [Fulvia fulva]UJO11548.1 hypothetical protein CLAFUR5_00251 [Fulvia fulva]WPV09339.1 hypothetical protein CLAFUW4_00251 [Fulvia fulva]WPV23864.1 hypothetical protein CLAFUW7_00255 [Fulvia fulva]